MSEGEDSIMSTARKPVALIILDGWGVQHTESSAFIKAKAPTWDRLWGEHPHAFIGTSGMDVGLPEGQMGNSEVGHMNIGAGRVVYQNFTRISKAIVDGDFFTNPVLVEAVERAVAANKAVHVLGLLSPGGVHSHEEHLAATCKLAAERGAQQIYVHAFLDGRDTPPQSAEASIRYLEAELAKLGKGKIASLCGRYFAMDRDNRWDRVQKAYDAMTGHQAEYTASTALEALQAAYERGETDEFVKPTILVDEQGQALGAIAAGDSLINVNFRPDRAREITRALVEADFDGFNRARYVPVHYVMMTEYAADIATPCAYPPESLSNTLGEYLANLGKTQLRIAETEKYAHVTFFFSGGREEPYPGETRILVPSPQVATYDLQPEMSAPEVTDKLCAAIRSGEFDFIACNFANGDMVGHTGDYDAAVKAIEAVDACLAKVQAAIEEVGGDMLITADHGNVEMMRDPESGQPHTSHTSFPVGLVYAGGRQQQVQLRNGVLADLAPTILKLMGLPQPEQMTGKPLVDLH